MRDVVAVFHWTSGINAVSDVLRQFGDKDAIGEGGGSEAVG